MLRSTRPTTTTVKASEARRCWSALLMRVYRGAERIRIEKGGIPVAAIISARDLDRLELFEAQRDRDFKILEAFAEGFKDIPDEEIEREVAKAIAEVRAENRAREQEQAASGG